jgi:DNA-binding MurR/RpiR family transcriptional regulator
MTALFKLRTERGRMSAMDRRIADYILANAQLLRDYSSQQLADALKISQSSVVKFAQRLGFKGYPDLKLSITEAVARAAAVDEAGAGAAEPRSDSDATRSDALWQSKAAAARETCGLVRGEALVEAADRIAEAEMLFVAGDGTDGEAARTFAGRIALLGHRAVAHGQPHDLIASLSAAAPARRLGGDLRPRRRRVAAGVPRDAGRGGVRDRHRPPARPVGVGRERLPRRGGAPRRASHRRPGVRSRDAASPR